MRTIEQIDADIAEVKRHRNYALDTIERRLREATQARLLYATYSRRLDEYLDERNAHLAQSAAGEVS